MPSVVEAHPTENVSAIVDLPAPKEMLVDLARLELEYFDRRPKGQR